MLDCHHVTNRGFKKTHGLSETFDTYSFTLCQCQVLQAWRFQAHLMLAGAPGSRTGRCLYEGRLCPEVINNCKIHYSLPYIQQLLRYWLIGFPGLLFTAEDAFALTFTASKIRIALAKSFNLRQALSAASRIFGSGTRS